MGGSLSGGCQGKWEEVAKVGDDQDTLSMFKNKNCKNTPKISPDKLLSVDYFLCSVQPHPAKGRLIIHIFVEWVNEQINKAYIMDYNEGSVVYILWKSTEGNEMAFKKDSIYPDSILGLLREDEKGDSKISD